MHRLSAFVAIASLVSLIAIQPWDKSAVGQLQTAEKKQPVEESLNAISVKLDRLLETMEKSEPEFEPKPIEVAEGSDIPTAVIQWITEAKNDLQAELEQMDNAYRDWKEKTVPVSSLEEELQKDKLKTIFARTMETEHELAEAKLRASLLSTRLEQLDAEEKEQSNELRNIATIRATQAQFEGEIARKQDLYDEIVKKLADIDLIEHYGN